LRAEFLPFTGTAPKLLLGPADRAKSICIDEINRDDAQAGFRCCRNSMGAGPTLHTSLLISVADQGSPIPTSLAHLRFEIVAIGPRQNAMRLHDPVDRNHVWPSLMIERFQDTAGSALERVEGSHEGCEGH
jgi:hypothetical protein